MRIGWIKGCEIRLHPLFGIMILLAAMVDELPAVMVSFSAVLYHELMHMLAAVLMGYSVTSLELLPFGSSAVIEGLYEEAPHAELLIALAASAILGYWGKQRRISLTLLACTVILTAIKEGRSAQWLWLRELTGKKRKLMKEETLPIRHIAASGDMKLGQLAARFLPHRYHLVTVLDEKCTPIATISENEVVEALMKVGSHTRIFAILSTNT